MIKDKNKGVDIMKTKIIKRAYKFRIYPTLEQISFFAKSFGCVRKVHNLMLDDRKKAYEEYKSTGIKTKYPTPAKYKEEYPYLKEVDSLALANAQLNLEKAYKNFLKNKDFGFPKYKCKSIFIIPLERINEITFGYLFPDAAIYIPLAPYDKFVNTERISNCPSVILTKTLSSVIGI